MIVDQSASPPFTGYPQQPYHSSNRRRASPPGSPSTAPRACCFRRPPSQIIYQRDPIFCCCPAPASFLASLGICCLVLGYTLLGAFTFMTIEGGSFGETSVAASKPAMEVILGAEIRSRTVDRLWSITEDLNILYKDNWTRLAAQEVMEFQDSLVRALRLSGSHGGHLSRTGTMFYHHSHRWTFGSSFLYSLTLITTIGYGSVSPRTPMGKLITILYAVIGIPLMLIYLSTMGEILARTFRYLYSKACGTPNSLKKQQPNTQPNINHNHVPVDSKLVQYYKDGDHLPRRYCSQIVTIPVSLCILIIVLYVAGGALLFNRLENWSLLEGSYFCFTSLGTIGFGDLVPGEQAEDLSHGICSIYILVGMALIAMCFNLVQDELGALIRSMGRLCGNDKTSHHDYNQYYAQDEEIPMSVVS